MPAGIAVSPDLRTHRERSRWPSSMRTSLPTRAEGDDASETPVKVRSPPWSSSSAGADDPDGLLDGQGAQVRSIRLTRLSLLDEPPVRALMAQALAKARRAIDPAATPRTVVKSISAKQRPRRPA